MTLTGARSDPQFVKSMSLDRLNKLENEVGTVVALWPDLTIAYVNPAWTQFAAANHGEPSISERWSVGACILDAISPQVRPFFASHYRYCLRERKSWYHDYECSSPSQYRVFHMQVFPLDCFEALIVINSLRVEFESVREGQSPLEPQYRHVDGLIRQCCDCRRFRRVESKVAWDWVPEWIRHNPPGISHGICGTCRAFYLLSGRTSISVTGQIM